jgi:hypothetical protein
MGHRRGYKTTHGGAPTPGRNDASDPVPLSLIRRLYLAAQRTGLGRQYLASLRAHLRHDAGDPKMVRRQLVEAFGDEPFPFADVDPEWRSRAQTLRLAFGETPFEFPGEIVDTAAERMSPERWMIDMPLVSPSTCRYVLPRVMADLLTVYSGEFRCTDLVVQYLDVEGDHRPENLRDIVPLVEKLVGKGAGVQWVQEYNAEASHRREGKLAQFRPFTVEQCEAVLAWLVLARTWPECAMVRDNLANAIDYWQSRSDEQE